MHGSMGQMQAAIWLYNIYIYISVVTAQNGVVTTIATRTVSVCWQRIWKGEHLRSFLLGVSQYSWCQVPEVTQKTWERKRQGWQALYN